jgi:hypothetical protein
MVFSDFGNRSNFRCSLFSLDVQTGNVGTITNPANHGLKDINKREWQQFIPIVLFIAWIGFISIYFFCNYLKNSTKNFK